MKFLVPLLLVASLTGFAQETIEKPLGKCIGSEARGLDARLKNEEFCAAYEDNMEACNKNHDRCEFQAEQKKCVANDREDLKATYACSSTWTVVECEKKSECKWDYVPKSCNAKDPSSSADSDFCETYDDNASSCKAQSKCAWGAL